MAMAASTYSRMIAWLKILLPLAALVLLSTLFLFARPSNPVATLPFAKIEIQEKLRSQGITDPYFSGQTTGGETISLEAETARPQPKSLHLIEAEVVDVQISFDDQSEARFQANEALLNTRTQSTELANDVRITSSTGYEFKTEALSLDLLQGRAVATKPVTGAGPFGAFKAGSMIYSGDSAEGNARFHFNDGIELIYTPGNENR